MTVKNSVFGLYVYQLILDILLKMYNLKGKKITAILRNIIGQAIIISPIYRTEYKIKHAAVIINGNIREDFPSQFHIPHIDHRLKAFWRNKKQTKIK